MDNNQKLAIIASSLNSYGYVFDFSTAGFDSFTANSIGVPLCRKYNLSKGRSLECFISDTEITVTKKIKLLKDLFEYYEIHLMDSDKENNPERYIRYNKNKGLLDSLISENKLVKSDINIDSDYIQKQIIFINENVDKNPTQAVGVSKELIESICKTILKKNNIEFTKNDNINALVKVTFDSIELLEVIPSDKQKTLSESLKKIRGGFTSIIMGISEIRNDFGGGHGEPSDFVALDIKYAKLVANFAITISSFLSNYV